MTGASVRVRVGTVLAAGCAVVVTAACSAGQDDGVGLGNRAAERMVTFSAPPGWSTSVEPAPEGADQVDRADVRVVGGRPVLYAFGQDDRLKRVSTRIAVEVAPVEVRSRCAQAADWIRGAAAALAIEPYATEDSLFEDSLVDDCADAAAKIPDRHEPALVDSGSGERLSRGRYQYWLQVGGGTEVQSGYARVEVTLTFVLPGPGDPQRPPYRGPAAPPDATATS